MAYIDPIPTEPIPVPPGAGADPDSDSAPSAAESVLRAESVSMTVSALMARSGKLAQVAEATRREPKAESREAAAEATRVVESSEPQPASSKPAWTERFGRPGWPIVVVALLLLLAFALIALNLTSGGGERIALPLDGRKTAVIHIDSGADSIVVGTAELGDELAVVTTPGGDDSGVRPLTQLDGNQLRVSTEDLGDAKAGSPVQIDVRIAAGVRWDVVVGKGAKQVLLALGSGQVNLVELRGGADLADITLPKPVGEMAVRIPTGLATAALHVPAAVPTKVTFGSGAGRAVVDGAERQGIASRVTIYGVNGKGGTGGPDGYTAAKDRLLVDVSAGVGTLSLDRS